MVNIKPLTLASLVILYALLMKPRYHRKKTENRLKTLNFVLIGNGSCLNNFIDIINRNERHYCYHDQFFENIKISLPRKTNEKLFTKNETQNTKKPPQLNCLQQLTQGQTKFNVVPIVNGVKILTSQKQIDAILVPIPPNVKTEPIFKETNEERLKRRKLAIKKPGKCVVILFYGSSCVQSQIIGSAFMSLPTVFPDIVFGAIDAFKFKNLSNSYGIYSVPTILVFHQGVLHYAFQDNVDGTYYLLSFVTNIKPLDIPWILDDYSLLFQFNKTTDYYLYFAWFFIALCAIWYFINPKLYQIIFDGHL